MLKMIHILILENSRTNYFIRLLLIKYAAKPDNFAKLSSVQVQLRTEISLIISVRPTPPTRASIFEAHLGPLGG